MRLLHVFYALTATFCWGTNFVVIHLGLGTMPPIFMAGVRFGLVALFCLVLPRPKIAPMRLVLLGLIQFAGQFGLLFQSMAVGMPSGLAALVMQAQVFFTILFAALLIGERLHGRAMAGLLIAALGLGLIAVTIDSHGQELTYTGFALCLSSALCWGFGNILMRQAAGVSALALVSWMSLVAAPALFVASWFLEPHHRILAALSPPTAGEIGVALYLSLPGTMLAFGLWSYLLRFYEASRIVPFALCIPLFGALSSALVLGERFSPLRLAGMGLVGLSLAIMIIPWHMLTRKRMVI